MEVIEIFRALDGAAALTIATYFSIMMIREITASREAIVKVYDKMLETQIRLVERMCLPPDND